jgi:phosphoglycolate phosphatase-like HAD superfamily hydrolase
VIGGASPDGVRATKSDVLGASHHGIDTVVVEWGYGGSDFDGPAVERPLRHVSTVAALREVLGV